MLRPLVTLVVGIMLAVLLTAVIAGGRTLAPVLGPILLTAGVGTAVLAVVVRRTRVRERALDLSAAHDDARDTHDTHDGTDDTPFESRDQTHKEPDRG